MSVPHMNLSIEEKHREQTCDYQGVLSGNVCATHELMEEQKWSLTWVWGASIQLKVFMPYS